MTKLRYYLSSAPLLARSMWVVFFGSTRQFIKLEADIRAYRARRPR